MLLSKLKNVGFGLLKLLYSYLCDRSQVVKIKGAESNRILIPSGVLQGSILGPIFFAIFINDLSLVVKYCKCLIFADDTKLFCRIMSELDSQNLQLDLEAVYKWSIENNLSLNVNKCKILSVFTAYEYKLNNLQITRTKVQKDLFIFYDAKFTFDDHLDYVLSKASKKLGFVIRSTKEDLQSLITLYKSLVQPIMHLVFGLRTLPVEITP